MRQSITWRHEFRIGIIPLGAIKSATDLLAPFFHSATSRRPRATAQREVVSRVLGSTKSVRNRQDTVRLPRNRSNFSNLPDLRSQNNCITPGPCKDMERLPRSPKFERCRRIPDSSTAARRRLGTHPAAFAGLRGTFKCEGQVDDGRKSRGKQNMNNWYERAHDVF